jgi:Chloroplast import apparatus Tic20-like
MLVILRILALLQAAAAFHGTRSFCSRNVVCQPLRLSEKSSILSGTMKMAEKKPKEPEKEGWERIQALVADAENDPKKRKGPPIYEPGTYLTHVLAALAYIVPIVDSQDLGKYMFEAYPSISAAYNAVFGSIAGIYNGVPFLPFGVFFLMSYICRAPTFPVEVRFHVAQAFMLSIIQFVPSLGFGLLEKAGVPGMAVLYNTGL